MSTLVVDYAFNGTQVANPDGSLGATSSGCTVVPGPGATALGTYPRALSFGSAGKLQVNLPLAQLGTQKFCVRTVVKVDTPVTTRQSLVETAAIPLSLYLDAIPGSSDFKAVVSVASKDCGWAAATTEFAIPLKVATWYTIDLIYDTDTLGVAIDGSVVTVLGFPVGTITSGAAPALFVGTSAEDIKFHFSGSMAALQLHNGIPADLEALLDEHRNSPEWFITCKYQQLKATLNLGPAVGAITYDAVADAYTQLYNAGLLMFSERIGTAFEMHGAIFTAYQALSSRSELGSLVADETAAAVSGARKSLFSKGGLYWSAATGAVPLVGQIFVDYEAMGEAAAVGLPTAAATAISGGTEQLFQGARMYLKDGASRAFAVQGAILAKFLSTGNVATCGHPIGNEHDIKHSKTVLGRASEFENCTIYWHASVGAYAVHGAIRDMYRSLKGPSGALGFPTSDEQNVPGVPQPARCNTFQHGSLLRFGGDVVVCQPYKIFVGRVDTQNSEGIGMGQNDLYFRFLVEDNGHQLLNARYPSSGNYAGRDIVNLDQPLALTLTPNNLGSSIKVTFDIWESDSNTAFGGADDHLGSYSYTLDAANAWGMRTSHGNLNTGPFPKKDPKVNSIAWAVHPAEVGALTDVQRWWGVRNRPTSELTYGQYGTAFPDVDPSPGLNDFQNWGADAFQWIFYEAVVKGICKDGNCFGMALEAIYSLKGRSVLGMPINQFTEHDWSTVVGEFNVKHEYQVGAAAMWWFAGQFLSGDTHDPVSVFQSTRDCFNRGDNPVVCVSQDYDFGGEPHCLMPIGWDTSAKPWKLRLCDPNFPGQVRSLLVDPDANTFSYDGGNKYSGGAWSGGRFHYIPYHVLCDQPRTPVGDIIMRLLSGVIFIIGADTDTVRLTDENGVDLDAFGADAVARRKAKQPLDHKLVGLKGFSGKGTLDAQVLLRTQPRSNVTAGPPRLLDARLGANLKLGDLARSGALPPGLQQLASDPKRFQSLAHRDVKSVVADPKALASLDPASVAALRGLATLRSAGTSVRHQLKGNKQNAQLQYAVKSGSSQVRLSAPLAQSEAAMISLDDLGSSSAVLGLQPTGSKVAKLEIMSRIGSGSDHMQIVIDNLVADQDNPLKVNVKPSLGGVDILSRGVVGRPGVTVQTTIGGKVTKYDYELPFGGGMRIRPSTISGDRSLKVSKIDSLFGPLHDSAMVKPKG